MAQRNSINSKALSLGRRPANPQNGLLRRSFRPFGWVLCLALGLATMGCSTFSSFKPTPIDEVPFRDRMKEQSRDGLVVSTAVPSRKEAKAIFGVDLAEKHIQPVWFELQNNSQIPFAFLLSALDPNYFSAHEAAYRSHYRWRPGTNRKIDTHFDSLQLEGLLLPGQRQTGFVFTNLKLGTKEVRVALFGPGRIENFEFYASVPGFRADYHEVDWEALYARETTDYTTEAAFREALSELPCCTTRKDGKGKGDPLNLVIIGDVDVVGAALVRSGWDETEKLSAASAWRTFKAFFGGEYKYSPMSSLYFDGRSQDAGFQRARDTIHQRNHMRLWLSTMTFQGQSVWIGTVTRDIGVYFTWRAWNLTTHAIDPYVDEARGSVREEFSSAQSLGRFGYISGVGLATQDDPHRNLMNAPWWTDGDRLVLQLSPEEVPMDQIDFLYWEWGTGPEQDALINEALRKARKQGLDATQESDGQSH